MHPQLINMVYTKKACDLHIEVIGIPANVCTHCFYRIIPGKIAQYIDTLTDPLFEAEMRHQEKILPTPHVDIQFPPIERTVYAYS
jgi:hypothetical protein